MTQFNLLPLDTIKYRENSADSVVFHLDGHTPEAPRTCTYTRTLPKPRKGNNGTMKVMLNVRNTVNIGSVEEPNYVPVIAKLETSVPVGASIDDLYYTPFGVLEALAGSRPDAVQQIKNNAYAEQRNIFIHGLLPNIDAPRADVIV